jgi:threonine/homoserine/homoserine lactone efflux protein
MLTEAITDLLPVALGIALSPFPVVAAVLVVSTPRARSNGPAFAIGWLAGLAVLTSLVVLVFAGADDAESSSRAVVDVLRVLAGLALFAGAARKWRSRPRDGEIGPTPGWMASIETLSTGRSLVLGLGLGGANPKNLAFALAAASTIVTFGTSGADTAIAVAVFVVLSSLSVIGPVVASLLFGDRVAGPLESVKGFMLANNNVIMMVVFVLIGAKVLGAGISGLVG